MAATLLLESLLIGLCFLFGSFSQLATAALRINDSNPLEVPAPGSAGLRILSPTILELTLVTTKEADPARVKEWDFVRDNFTPNLPSAQEFSVLVNGQAQPVKAVGFKRRALYAPVRQRDLRIGNYLYLELATPIADKQNVEVTNPGGRLWSSDVSFSASADPQRFSPAIHVNEVGYVPAYSKKAMVGYYLGSLGEMNISTQSGFQIVEVASGRVMHQGQLKSRRDVGYIYTPTPYQNVWEADFSEFKTPGQYRLAVPGLGASFPFLIHDGVAATFARAYALGLYHQRCGMANVFPFTRHAHEACHIAMAEVPTIEFKKTQEVLAEVSGDFQKNPRHTAPQLKDVEASLYPFVNRGKVDVSGGHHDAGDYSKYTINSAGLIHYLVFAADALAGAGALDNLGIPESGDGKSDLLQEAKWEADFLAKMQDADGGFYFLVYPRDRRYEDDVLPDKGDSQVVWPKTTGVTAAAVAALAEAGSSPLFKTQFPSEASLYLQKAQLGWAFLEKAIAQHGQDGAYQKITHYGNEFMHDDELAWAAAALFVATGDSKYHEKLKAWFDPSDPKTRRWDWWRLFEGYGCATRAYAFAARSGRLAAGQLDRAYLTKCESQILAAAEDQERFARESAYGTSFPDPNKQYRSAGWYFSSERAFDLTVAYQIEPRPGFLEAIISNMNYEGGCNPVNVAYVTGLGWKRQRDVVHQYAQNDRRVLPPSGLPLGNVQASFQNTLYHYKGELSALSFPGDWVPTEPYPFYDRWGDSFNTTTEFVVTDQARSLASLAFYMALTPLKDQSWRPVSTQIAGLPAQIPAGQTITATLAVPGVDLSQAQIVWEARDQEPIASDAFRFAAKNPGEQWVEAEALLPDGRRFFAATNFTASFSLETPPNSFQKAALEKTSEMVALFHLDTDTADALGKVGPLALGGHVSIDSGNVGWMSNRAGASLAVHDLGDKASVQIPSAAFKGATAVSLEAMIYVTEFKAYNRAPAKLLSLMDTWNASLELTEDPYTGPQVRGANQFSFGGAALKAALSPKQWHHFNLTIDSTGYSFKIDGVIVATQQSDDLANWRNANTATLEIGNFDGWIDEVTIRSFGTSYTPPVLLAAPVITPNGGAFTESILVNMQTEVPGGSIRYTTNGNEPDSASQLYTAPIAIGKSTTIKAKTFKTGAQESSVTSATILIGEASSGQVTFVKSDDTTKGNWKGVYGTDGFNVIGNSVNYPTFVRAALRSGSAYTWNVSTTDPRALLKASGNDRSAACWYASGSFNVDLNFTDGKKHQVALYAVDWDRAGRSETIEVIDAVSGALLDRQTVANFAEGKYLVWELSGNVTLRLIQGNGPNALLMGLFFDPASQSTGNFPNPTTEKTIRSLSRSSQGTFQMRLHGEVGTKYVVEASSNLIHWVEIGTITAPTDDFDFIDPTRSSGPRFYRVNALP